MTARGQWPRARDAAGRGTKHCLAAHCLWSRRCAWMLAMQRVRPVPNEHASAAADCNRNASITKARIRAIACPRATGRSLPFMISSLRPLRTAVCMRAQGPGSVAHAAFRGGSAWGSQPQLITIAIPLRSLYFPAPGQLLLRCIGSALCCFFSCMKPVTPSSLPARPPFVLLSLMAFRAPFLFPLPLVKSPKCPEVSATFLVSLYKLVLAWGGNWAFKKLCWRFCSLFLYPAWVCTCFPANKHT